MGRGTEHVSGRALFDHPAQVQDHDVVREKPHHAQVVGDEQIPEAPFFLKPVQQVENLRADGDIQGGHGLVGHHQRR